MLIQPNQFVVVVSVSYLFVFSELHHSSSRMAVLQFPFVFLLLFIVRIQGTVYAEFKLSYL